MFRPGSETVFSVCPNRSDSDAILLGLQSRRLLDVHDLIAGNLNVFTLSLMSTNNILE